MNILTVRKSSAATLKLNGSGTGLLLSANDVNNHWHFDSLRISEEVLSSSQLGNLDSSLDLSNRIFHCPPGSPGTVVIRNTVIQSHIHTIICNAVICHTVILSYMLQSYVILLYGQQTQPFCFNIRCYKNSAKKLLLVVF